MRSSPHGPRPILPRRLRRTCPQTCPQVARKAVDMLIIEFPQIARKALVAPLASALAASYLLSCAERGAQVGRNRTGRQYVEAARPERKVSRSGGRKRNRLGEFFSARP